MKRVTFNKVNFTCFVVGMLGVWHVTHRWEALAFTFIASLHFTMEAKS